MFKWFKLCQVGLKNAHLVCEMLDSIKEKESWNSLFETKFN